MEESLTPEARRRLMHEGRACFNRGEFYEAHESWEEVWNVIDDPDRRWVQGLIQVATGFHKLRQGRGDVALTLLRRALDKLRDAPERLDGVDVAAARRGAEAMVEGILAGELPDPRVVKLLEPA